MSYLEKQQGLPEEEYSPAFLELDSQSGPWLLATQQESVVTRGDYPAFDLDLEQGVITFGDDQRVGVVASIRLLGTYSADDKTWLWSWSAPQWADRCQEVQRLSEDHSQIPEFVDPTFTCTETKAWSVAAAAAFALKADGCFRVPGEVATYVALFNVTELEPDDPRAQSPRQDPQAADQALAEFAGPAALNIGGLLLDALRSGDEVTTDHVIAALHAMCDNLQQLAQSPMGQGTPAAQQAETLGSALRQGALCLAVPPGPQLMEGATELLVTLKEVAQRYGAWTDAPDDEQQEPPS